MSNNCEDLNSSKSEETALEIDHELTKQLDEIPGKKDFNTNGPGSSLPIPSKALGDRRPNKSKDTDNPEHRVPTEQAGQNPPHSSNTTASCKDLEPGIDDQWVFLDTVPDFMTCRICSGVFESPQLLSCCGTNICKKCMDRHLQQIATLADKQPSCPFCRSTDYKLIHNIALEQSINQLKVHCRYQHKGCVWTGILERGNLHLKECDFVPIDCPNGCGCKQFERRKLSDHMLICPHTHTTCSFETIGCDAKQPLLRQAAQKHANNYRSHHLLLIAQRNIKLLKDYRHFCTCLQSKSYVNVANKELVKSQRETLASTKHNIKSLKGSLQEIQRKTASLKTELRNQEICSAEIKKKVTIMKSTEATLRYYAAEVQILPVPNAIVISCPPVAFTIDNFGKRMLMNDMWLSPPFYTHVGGYKMSLSVQSNGTFVSVGIHFLLGEFDEHLLWPFPGAIFTITAINQRANKCNKSVHLELVGKDTLYIRSKQINGGLGLGYRVPDFLPHSDLPPFLSKDNCFKLMVYRIQFLPL